MYATQEGYDVRESKLKRHCGLNHLHLLTTSTYCRARLSDSERFRKQWVATFGELRGGLKFRILKYVLMPEHFRALIWPTAEANPSQIMPKIELHAQQSRETRPGQAPGRLAVVPARRGGPISGMTVRSWA
jgi:REP element-mobilizing transposase RayT